MAVSTSPKKTNFSFYLILGALVFGVSEWYVVSHFSALTEAWKKISLGNQIKHYQRTVTGNFRNKEEAPSIWKTIQAKIDHLKVIDEEVEKLRLENENLRLKVETQHFQTLLSSNRKVLENYESKLKSETGTPIGRILASISYEVPPKLDNRQLYVLASGYMEAEEYEKTAKIMSSIFNREKSEPFKTPRNFLMAGIAWYKTDNFLQADQYFNEIIKKPETAEIAPFQAQARLWRALSARKMSKELKSQFYLKDLLDHHPHSQESGWINHIEVKSEPGSGP